jgi:hypothetical protein
MLLLRYFILVTKFVQTEASLKPNDDENLENDSKLSLSLFIFGGIFERLSLSLSLSMNLECCYLLTGVR